MGPSLQSLCPARCRGHQRRPRRRPRPARRAAAREADGRRAPTTTAGRSHKVTITPLALFDLMLVTDYLPPLRAILPIAVRSALDGDGALLARMIRDSTRARRARLAARLLDRPLRRPSARRRRCRGTRARRSTSGPRSPSSGSRALPPDAFAPFDPPIVVEDEIDLCLRWPDVPRAAVDRRAAAVSDRADADPPGRRGPAHAAGGLRRASRRGSRARSGSSSPASATRPSATRATARATRSCASSTARRRRSAVQADPDRHPGGPRRAGVVRVAARLRRPAAQGRAHVRALGGDARRPAARPLAGRAGDVRRRPARRLVGDQRQPAACCERYEAVDGRDRDRQRQRRLTLRVAGAKAARGTVTLRSGGRLSGTLGGRRISLRLGAPDVARPRPPGRWSWRADIADVRSYCRLLRASYGQRPAWRRSDAEDTRRTARTHRRGRRRACAR